MYQSLDCLASAPGLPLVPAAATDRARLAWLEFSEAMRELVADGTGWMIVAGDRITIPDGAYMNLTRTHQFADPGYPNLTLEGLETISL